LVNEEVAVAVGGVTGVVARAFDAAARRDGDRRPVAVGAVIPGGGGEGARLQAGVGGENGEAEGGLEGGGAPAHGGQMIDDLLRVARQRRAGDVLVEGGRCGEALPPQGDAGVGGARIGCTGIGSPTVSGTGIDPPIRARTARAAVAPGWPRR